ncbi:YkgJ family cysteine cluster protein [Planctomyces sp. SH-PL14]|uniref:YkgJ family cysteine cluster protein n=1 Tax=Planctomyces sp. SH-PL14 TaxID=1632864 RepID=UPI00078BC831|nr:YkgJ family cysteine cluster protein [Planctomyces sp. SH-PL14]AMV17160.1 Flagellin N-methylase [Planctomyces sp. SH-PL14]
MQSPPNFRPDSDPGSNPPEVGVLHGERSVPSVPTVTDSGESPPATIPCAAPSSPQSSRPEPPREQQPSPPIDTPSSDSDAADRPWFAPGLSFTCTQCGNCCTGGTGYVWVTEDDLRKIAAHLDVPIGEVRLLHTRRARGQLSLREHPNGDCIYFDTRTRGCRIYPVRPIQCRTWPFWEQTTTSPEAWKRTCETCPGAGSGTFVPWEEVARRVEASGI